MAVVWKIPPEETAFASSLSPSQRAWILVYCSIDGAAAMRRWEGSKLHYITLSQTRTGCLKKV